MYKINAPKVNLTLQNVEQVIVHRLEKFSGVQKTLATRGIPVSIEFEKGLSRLVSARDECARLKYVIGIQDGTPRFSAEDLQSMYDVESFAGQPVLPCMKDAEDLLGRPPAPSHAWKGPSHVQN